MAIEATYRIVDSDGKPIELPSGTYFCNECLKKLKTIPYPFTDIIEPCRCGSKIVFTI